MTFITIKHTAVLHKFCSYPVKMRIFGRPWFRIRYHDRNTLGFQVCQIFHDHIRHDRILIQNRDLCLGIFRHTGKAQADTFLIQYLYLDSFRLDIRWSRRIKWHRAINTTAGIPSAVWHICIIRDHLNLILTDRQKICQIYIKIRITIRSFRDLISIEADTRILINSLKLQDIGLLCCLGIHIPNLLINVLATLKISTGAGCLIFFRPFFIEHGIMRQINVFYPLLPFFLHRPVPVKIDFSHRRSSFPLFSR